MFECACITYTSDPSVGLFWCLMLLEQSYLVSTFSPLTFQSVWLFFSSVWLSTVTSLPMETADSRVQWVFVPDEAAYVVIVRAVGLLFNRAIMPTSVGSRCSPNTMQHDSIEVLSSLN